MARPKLDAPNYKLVRCGNRFYVRWWENGTWQRVSTGQTDKRQAAIWLAQFVAGRGTPARPEQPTVSLILDGYLADRKPVVRAHGTLEAAAKALRRHLGDLQPEHLTKERVRFYVRQRRAEGHMVGPATARRKKPTGDGTIIRELVTLRAPLQFAVAERRITNVPTIEAPRQPRGRDRWLTRVEADRLLEAAITSHVRLFILLALHTAARTGALLQLQWDQVHFGAGVIELGDGHGNKRRDAVPITSVLRAELVAAREIATCPSVVEWGCAAVGSIKTGFTAACRRAGINGATPHTLRHTAVTWMVQANVPMPMVARYASMSLAMVEKRYGHHSPEWLRQAADALTGQVAPETRQIIPGKHG